MTNATLQKFGDPATRLAEVGSWRILLRPKQVTLGSLVLVNCESATAFGELSAQAYADLRDAISGIERCLSAAFRYDRINYLMLMMVDPDVHFHVIPRYATAREFAGQQFTDSAWPGPPDVTSALATDERQNQAILEHLCQHW